MHQPDHASPSTPQENGSPVTPRSETSKRTSLQRWLRRTAFLLGSIVLIITALLAWNLRPPAVGAPDNLVPIPVDQAASAPVRLRVLTWNVWGLLWITPRREERLVAVAREVAALRPDLVGFQEAFVNDDRQKLIAALRDAGLPYARYFPSGLVGSGVLLVSRFPIESDGFVRYQKGGRPEALQQGDWWAGKGLSLSLVRLPNGVPLYVANTHLHARYRDDASAAHQTQLAQSAQLIPWVRRVQSTGTPALWIGDWNSTPDTDIIAPLMEAGSWKVLTRQPTIDNIFGSGSDWEWTIIQQGNIAGRLEGEPRVPWSDHTARWVDVELRPSTRKTTAPDFSR